jgi:outer membrane protein TolC
MQMPSPVHQWSQLSMPRSRQIATQLALVTLAVMTAGCSSFYNALTDTEVIEFSGSLVDALVVTPEPLTQPLTVEEAVRRSVLYNHSVRAKELEAAHTLAQVHAQSADMLPRLAAEADFNRRLKPSFTRSNTSQSYSTSSDPGIVARDITLSWNILDFGLSMLRNEQGIDKAHQQAEEANRLRNRIVEETRSSYWHAVALEALERGMAQLDRETRDALQVARKAASDDSLEPMAAINLQRDILNLQRELNQVLSSLAGAGDQLRQAIGLPLSGRLRFSTQRRVLSRADVVRPAGDDLKLALEGRPEIRQVMYEMRITEHEATAAVLKLLPGVSLDARGAADSNSYLLHSHWISWGARVAGDLMAAVRLPDELDALEAKQHVHRQNALATAAMIVMQVHVARARLAVHARGVRDAEVFADVQRQLLRQVKAAAAAGKVGADSVVRERLATLLAETRAIVAFAGWHAALAAYATATGQAPDRIVQVEAKSRS